MKLGHIFLISIFFTVSCVQKFEIMDHFDPSLPIEVIDQYPPSPVRVHTIDPSDNRHKKLTAWLESNEDGWEKTDHDTHAGLIIIRQKDFVLLLYKDNKVVVAGYDVIGNDMKQFKRIMDSNELMFIVQ